MFDHRNLFTRALFCGAVSAVVALSALAQETLVLEEVIVTAQKRSESLQDTPISIAAFGTEELQAMGVYEPGQISDYTPNLQISRQTGSLDNYSFNIRGIGSGETSLLNENAVGLYIDGVYISRSTSSVFDIIDLERVEVLRGPQSALYGRNNIGGSINLITEKPSDEFGFQQAVTVGNRGFLRSKTTIDTGKLGDFSGKISYNYNEKDGFVKNSIHGNELGEQESKAYRIALRWDASDALRFDYTYDNSERENNAALSQIVHVRNVFLGGAITKAAAAFADADRLGQLPAAFSTGIDSFSDIKAHTLTLEWQINDNLIFKSITSDRDWKSGTTGTDFGSFLSDGATVLAGPTGQLVPAGEYVSTFYASRLSDNEQFTQEFQLIGTGLDDRLQFTVGLYYFEEESNEDNPQTFVLPATLAFGRLPQGNKSFLCRDPTFSNPFACVGKDVQLSAPIFQYGSDNESVAAYGQFTYGFTDALDVTLGLRYTEDDKKAYLRQSLIEDGLVTVNADDDWSNTSASLTANYHWNDDLMTYLTVSQGYRSGGFGARAMSAEDFQLGFDEETVTNFEMGMKSDWINSRVRLNAAIFYLEYEDAQVNSFNASTAGASSVVLNAGELEIKGLELELTALLSSNLRLMLNYGYTDAEFVKFISRRLDPVSSFPITGIIEDISDVATVSFTPEHNGSAVLVYNFDPFSYGRLSARLDVTYVGEMEFHDQLTNYIGTDNQTLWNARLTLSEVKLPSGNLELSAWGRNLTDEKYREWGIDFAALGSATNSFKELRSYGVDLIWQFGR